MGGDPVTEIEDIAPIGRDEAAGLAATEFARMLDQLAELEPIEYALPTVCDGWTIRDMVAHVLGAADAAASRAEMIRQVVRGRRWVRGTGRPLVDGINEVQIAARADLDGQQLCERLAAVAPAAVRGRREVPGLLRRLPVEDPTGGRFPLGFLVDVIYTRDQWLHRIDIAEATGRPPVLTADHDARIVADVVRQWAHEHGRPVELELTGPAGGHYRQGRGGQRLELDAVAFCWTLSGRGAGSGLLANAVAF
jgi:uncharacterized protein (TIGR03083 family)